SYAASATTSTQTTALVMGLSAAVVRPTDVVWAVTGSTVVRRLGSKAGLSVGLRVGAVDYFTKVTLNTAYRLAWQPYPVDPSTGAPWSASAVNAFSTVVLDTDRLPEETRVT